MSIDLKPTSQQQSRGTWRQWSKLARVRIGFVLMLIVASFAFLVWWPRRTVVAVLLMGGDVYDSQADARVASLQSQLPADVWLFVKPWSECNQKRKLFIVLYAVLATVVVLVYFYKDPEKYCTTVTPEGHLHWWLTNFNPNYEKDNLILYYMCMAIIFIPILMLWNVTFKAIIAISILPLFGFIYGLRTDSKGSIWCHYTSYTAIIAILIYILYKFKIYNILK